MRTRDPHEPALARSSFALVLEPSPTEDEGRARGRIANRFMRGGQVRKEEGTFHRPARDLGFTLTDLLVTLAVLSVLAFLAVAVPPRLTARAKEVRCKSNLQQVNRAILQFAGDRGQRLPGVEGTPAPGGWWYYKELVKGYAGLTGPPSTNDAVFACPSDRGYGDGAAKPTPFCRDAQHVFTSYVFNGVNLPGVPNIAEREVTSIGNAARTLLVMEWTAHAPLSWHRSRTGQANAPFYSDAESVVGFVDGHVALVKVYYDGMNAAYTRDPIPGYAYQYSGD